MALKGRQKKKDSFENKRHLYRVIRVKKKKWHDFETKSYDLTCKYIC